MNRINKQKIRSETMETKKTGMIQTKHIDDEKSFEFHDISDIEVFVI